MRLKKVICFLKASPEYSTFHIKVAVVKNNAGCILKFIDSSNRKNEVVNTLFLTKAVQPTC